MRHVDLLTCNKLRPGAVDPSFFYRTENLALGLRLAGAQVGVFHVDDYKPSETVDTVVLQRPRMSLKLRSLLGSLRKRRILVVADVDDLIFDSELADFSPAVVNRVLPARKVQRQFASHARALALADLVTVSTQPLSSHAQRVLATSSTMVIPNCVHEHWRRKDTEKLPAATSTKFITYFPGTKSHDRDFETIVPVLERFLFKHAEVQLRITGPLTYRLQARSGQILHRQRVPFPEYHREVQRGWVNLAPLANTPFNECKSALKAIEAGYWNIPTLCSPTQDARRFNGAGAVLVSSEADWFDALDLCLRQPAYGELTSGLRERTLEQANVQEQARRFLAATESVYLAEHSR